MPGPKEFLAAKVEKLRQRKATRAGHPPALDTDAIDKRLALYYDHVDNAIRTVYGKAVPTDASGRIDYDNIDFARLSRLADAIDQIAHESAASPASTSAAPAPDEPVIAGLNGSSNDKTTPLDRWLDKGKTALKEPPPWLTRIGGK